MRGGIGQCGGHGGNLWSNESRTDCDSGPVHRSSLSSLPLFYPTPSHKDVSVTESILPVPEFWCFLSKFPQTSEKPQSSLSHQKLPPAPWTRSHCRPLPSGWLLSSGIRITQIPRIFSPLWVLPVAQGLLISVTKYLVTNNLRVKVFTLAHSLGAIVSLWGVMVGGTGGSWPHFLHSQEGESYENTSAQLTFFLVFIQYGPQDHGLMPPTVRMNQSTSRNSPTGMLRGLFPWWF